MDGIKSRREIKAIARANLAKQRGTGICILLLFWLICFAGAMFLGVFLGVFLGISYVTLGMFFQTTILIWLFVWLTIIFIDYPMLVNVYGCYIKIYRKKKTSASEVVSKLSVNYMRKVGGMFWMLLFEFLWMLLLIIPGFIMGYAYSMTPFILADRPNVTARQALKLSMRMTKGYKLKLFVLDLSWIGWGILNILTLGILWIVYSGPYKLTTLAGYYIELRDQSVASGAIDRSELV